MNIQTKNKKKYTRSSDFGDFKSTFAYQNYTEDNLNSNLTP